MKKIVVIIALVAPLFAFGHGGLIEMVDMSITESLAKFKAEQSQTVVQAFSGVKSWQKNADVKVRVYFNKNQDSIVYKCRMEHDQNGDENIVCAE